VISKNHRQNHNFQILYFLVGSCHTPDAAYALLKDLREEREQAIKNYEVSKIKEKAKILRAEKKLQSEDEAERLDAEAELLEIKNNAEFGEILYQAATDELKFIDDCIGKIDPQRKYKHLSDAEAHEACQQEEWKLELIYRAENYLLTTGTIPADHFDSMRMHPEFQTEIYPAINRITENIRSKANYNILENPIIKLLEG
jgi:hypothetical protein